MDPNTSAPTESAPINPLSAAFDQALGNGNAAPPPSSDFLESTLKLLESPDPTLDSSAPPANDGGDADGAGETPPAEPDKSKDPLAEIDEIFPDLDDKASGPAKERWGELKKELKQERAAVKAAQAELEQLKAKSLYDPAEVDSLKQQLEEYNKELAVYRIEATQEYKQAIEAPLKVIGDAAASIARRYELSEDAIFDALAQTDEAKQQAALTSLVEGMSDRDRLRIYQMADDTIGLLNKRAEMKARSHEAMQELEIRQKQTQEREQAERKRTFTSHMDRLFESLEDKLPFHPLDPNESKVAVLEQLKRDALQSDVAAAGLDVQAYSAAAGVLLPRLIKQFRAIAAENATLKSRVTGAAAVSPTRAKPAAAAPTAASGGFLEGIFSQLPS